MKSNFSSLKVNKIGGFTLLEVLVTTAIIGVLFIMASAIFINTVRSANKANITNEAKENASLVIQSLERDIRNASGYTINGSGSTLTLTYVGAANVVWQCQPAAGGANAYLTRQTFTVTNRDRTNGVSASGCQFLPTGGSGSTVLVTLNLAFTQGSSSGSSQDLQVLVSHTVSFSNRSN